MGNIGVPELIVILIIVSLIGLIIWNVVVKRRQELTVITKLPAEEAKAYLETLKRRRKWFWLWMGAGITFFFIISNLWMSRTPIILNEHRQQPPADNP